MGFQNTVTAIGGLVVQSVINSFGVIFIAGFTAASVSTATQIGYQFLTILAVFFPLLYILYVTRACIEGIGNAALPMASSVAQLLMRIGCALFLTYAIGESGVFYGEIFAWIGADVILIWGYKESMKKIKGLYTMPGK